jgi:diketogulonate reductase-like aldo/keto reductase
MTPATTPALTLNNGVTIPALGLGVFQSPPEETTAAVETALRGCYRLIDTAAAYDNESEVGEGIRRSGVPRDEIFVATKLWISDYGYDSAPVGFEASLRRLGLDHVDLYLLHQPVPTHFEDTVGAYEAAETFLADGRARAIGSRTSARSTSATWSSAPTSCRRSTRSSCTRTSRSLRCARSTPSWASSRRPGRRSAGSSSTCPAPTSPVAR